MNTALFQAVYIYFYLFISYLFCYSFKGNKTFILFEKNNECLMTLTYQLDTLDFDLKLACPW